MTEHLTVEMLRYSLVPHNVCLPCKKKNYVPLREALLLKQMQLLHDTLLDHDDRDKTTCQFTEAGDPTEFNWFQHDDILV